MRQSDKYLILPLPAIYPAASRLRTSIQRCS